MANSERFEFRCNKRFAAALDIASISLHLPKGEIVRTATAEWLNSRLDFTAENHGKQASQ